MQGSGNMLIKSFDQPVREQFDSSVTSSMTSGQGRIERIWCRSDVEAFSSRSDSREVQA